MIVEAIRYYHPWFVPPPVRIGWIKVLCPFHDDNRASAAINYDLDSFSCLACGLSGNAFTMVKELEGGDYAKTVAITKGLAATGDRPIPPKPTGKSGRRVFGDPRYSRGERPGTDRSVPPGIRGRTTPWT